jgi:acyl carrier protein
MSIEADLQRLIAREIAVDPEAGEIAPDSPLIASGRIDSMGLLQILGYVQQRYGVDLLASGTPQDFETIAGLAAATRRLRGDG